MIGKTISHYQILEKLGEGGMGVVYKAEDTKLKRAVALKFLAPHAVGGDEERARFLHEAQAAAALSHPNICMVFEIEEADGQPFIVMEYVEGDSLKEKMASGPLPLVEAIDIAFQVARGLDEAHEHDIVHRDIKPANVLVNPRGRAKITDFGLAKSAGQTKLTRTATTMGTVAYMSPEQARGEEVDFRTDLWSFGAMLHEMITGQTPFKGANEQAVIHSILNEEPASVRDLREEVPYGIEQIVNKCLARDPGERYQSTTDLVTDLDHLLREVEEQEIPAKPRTVSRPRQRRPIPWRSLIMSVSAALAIVVVLWLWKPTGCGAPWWPGMGWLAGSGESDAGGTHEGKTPPDASGSDEYGGQEEGRQGAGQAGADQEDRGQGGAGRAIPGEDAPGQVGPGVVGPSALDIEQPGRAGKGPSLAVLPFANTSDDPDTEFLADEIPASINNSLSRLRELRVVPRTSAFRFRGQENNLEAVARQLEVQAILTGKIDVRGNKLSIRVELVDIATDRQLWGERYIRDLKDLLALEEGIATAISEALQLRLTSQERDRLAKRLTDSPTAHEAYLKGRYHWHRRTREGLERSIGYFEQAIALDPVFALAYAGLADVYVVLAQWGYMPPLAAYPRAKEQATQALLIDADLAQAHAALGSITWSHEWDWPAAERHFQRAIALDPNYPTAHQWYGECLMNRGRFEEALAEARRARQLDPLSPIKNVVVGAIHTYGRNYDEALAECRRALELDEDLALAYYVMAVCYLKKQMYDEAVEMHLKSLSLTGMSEEQKRIGRLAYQTAGRDGFLRWLIAEGNQAWQQPYNTAYLTAAAYSELGEPEDAFSWLEQAFTVHSGYITYLKVDPLFDNLRGDPRFDELLRRIGLAD